MVTLLSPRRGQQPLKAGTPTKKFGKKHGGTTSPSAGRVVTPPKLGQRVKSDETNFSLSSSNYYGGIGASSRRRHREGENRKKVKIGRGIRKKLAKATGQHHVVARFKLWLSGSTEEEPDLFEEADDDSEAETPVPVLRLAPCHDDEALLTAIERRAIVTQALPDTLRSRRLFRKYAAHNDGYNLDSLSRNCSDLENKPALILIKTLDGMILGTFLGAAPFGQLTQVTTQSSALSLEAALFRLDLPPTPSEPHRQRLLAQSHAFRSQKKLLYEAPGAFILALRTSAFLAIAADARTGGAALRISSSLDSGTSEASDLFKSPPLHKMSSLSDDTNAAAEPPKQSSLSTTPRSFENDRFEVADVEVYGFEYDF